MSSASTFLSRAEALRSEARHHVGLRRARLLSKAESCARLAGSVERMTTPEPITTVKQRAGQPVLVEV